MCRRLKSGQFLGGVGTLILSFAMFFAQGGFEEMNLWCVAGMVVGIAFILWGLLKNPESMRVQELKRLILQARNAAAKVVTRHHAMGEFTTEVRNAYAAYDEALNSLNVEAEIEEGKVKEAITEFTMYVSFHVTRFVAWSGQIVSDSNTKQKLEIDEYQFVGHMAGRAKKAIQVIQKTLK